MSTEVLPKNTSLSYVADMYNLDGYILVSSKSKHKGICLFCRIDLQVVIMDDIIKFDEYIFCKVISHSKILVLYIDHQVLNNNTQLCESLSYK